MFTVVYGTMERRSSMSGVLVCLAVVNNRACQHRGELVRNPRSDLNRSLPRDFGIYSMLNLCIQ